jgi:LysM repeat protein
MRKKAVLALCLVVIVAMALPAAAAAAPEPAPQAAPAASACGGGFWHLVAWGQTLYSIARMYGVSAWAIASANHLASINRIYAGTWLFIPTGYCPPPPPPPPSCRTHYIVKWGDTLAKIGWRYGVSWWRIASANHLANANRIYAGQRLCIPW